MSEHDNDEEYLKNIVNNKENSKPSDDHIEKSDFKFSDNYDKFAFEAINILELPCGMFYPEGTKILVRAAKVAEIQAYSVVDNRNSHDIAEKMSDMLKTCVKVELPGGKTGSYSNLKIADRTYLIFYIRERTFQKGNMLNLECECDECGHTFETGLLRKHFVNGEVDESIMKYFDSLTKTFHFELNNGESVQIGLPTIGVERKLYEYVTKQVHAKKKPNMAYIKYDPFLIPNRSKITDEGIKKRLEKFTNMSEESFLFIEGFVSELEKYLGIKNVKNSCPECESEVHSEMRFPGGASTLFTVSNGFDQFIKK